MASCASILIILIVLSFYIQTKDIIKHCIICFNICDFKQNINDVTTLILQYYLFLFLSYLHILYLHKKKKEPKINFYQKLWDLVFGMEKHCEENSLSPPESHKANILVSSMDNSRCPNAYVNTLKQQFIFVLYKDEYDPRILKVLSKYRNSEVHLKP